MPRNPNGEYVLPSIYQAFSGQLIRADQHNIPLVDIAQALTGSVARNGSTPMTGNFPMGGNRITGLAPATAASDATRLDQVTKYSGFLNAVSNLAMAANEIPYATGVSAASKTAITPYARSLLATANAAAARTTLGLGAAATEDVIPISKGGTGSTTAPNARTSLGLGSVAIENVVPLSKGGTGATTQAAARTSLGLGSVATLSNVPITSGGTGATTATAARANLGLGSLATSSSINDDNWSGTDLSIANGGTGASTATAARANLGLDSGAVMAIASQAQAQAGSDNSTIMTPLRVEQHMTANAIGHGQSWVDVISSRTGGTTYTNNTGRPIMVNIWSRSGRIQVSTNGTTWVDVADIGTSNDLEMGSVIVPPGHSYRISTTSDNIELWSELR